MSIKSAGLDTTLMHYLARQLAAGGIRSAMLRGELRRVTEAASIDLGEAGREVAKLASDVTVLTDEIRFCAKRLDGEIRAEIIAQRLELVFEAPLFDVCVVQRCFQARIALMRCDSDQRTT